MYKVLVRYHETRVDLLGWRVLDLPSLDCLKVEAVGLALKVTIFKEDGSVDEEFCGPDVQYHVYPARQG